MQETLETLETQESQETLETQERLALGWSYNVCMQIYLCLEKHKDSWKDGSQFIWVNYDLLSHEYDLLSHNYDLASHYIEIISHNFDFIS